MQFPFTFFAEVAHTGIKFCILCNFSPASLCTWLKEKDKRTLSDLVRRTRYFILICICIYAYCNVNVLDVVYIHIFNVDITITLYLEHLCTGTSIARVDFIHGAILTHV